MKLKIISLLICIILLSCSNILSQESEPLRLTDQEKTALLNAISEDSVFAEIVKDTSTAVKLYQQYKFNVRESDSDWKADQEKLKKVTYFGNTNKLEFIPLIESLHENPDFKVGKGVSYLIRTDSSTILFDTGWDDDSIRCAFRYNLDLLGIDISEIDAIVISHNHGDHQNEWKWIKDLSFVDSDNENVISNIKIYVPESLPDLKTNMIYSKEPVKISEGVYTTGIIKAPLFFYSTQEQGLIINTNGKGIIVTGCSHSTLEKLLRRFDVLCDYPLYGILGGLHLPVYGDAERYMGYVITGLLPWEKFTLSDVRKKIGILKKRNLGLIGVSRHDSSDKTIQEFKKAFSNEYRDLKTGEWIVIK